MTFWKSLVSSLSADGVRQTGRGAKPALAATDFRRPRRMREGFLWADGLIMPRPCTIRDMSPLTAEIVLWHDDIKPATLRGPLKLYSSADKQEADCIVASRQGNILSVRFQSAFRAPTRRYP